LGKTQEKNNLMKENTTRILTWLYPQGNSPRWVNVDELKMLVPNMTKAGLQSSLTFLQQRKRILVERVSSIQSVSITTYGMKDLEQEIPAFSKLRREWKGDWWAVVFLEAPKQDSNFRFLRRVLLGERALALTRGVFLFPGYIPEKVSYELHHSYEGAVMVAPFRKWTFGDDKQIIGSILRISDLANTYSSISKEIDRLLEKKTIEKRAVNQSKIDISSIFDRLFTALQNDFGVLHEYYPQVQSGVDLVYSLQNLVAMG